MGKPNDNELPRRFFVIDGEEMHISRNQIGDVNNYAFITGNSRLLKFTSTLVNEIHKKEGRRSTDLVEEKQDKEYSVEITDTRVVDMFGRALKDIHDGKFHPSFRPDPRKSS